MFSSRTPASFAPNRLSRAVAARRALGAPLTDLTISNPTAAGINYPAEALLAALNDPRSLRYEPSARGLEEAREAVARWHARQGRPAHPERLVLAGSTSELYGWLFKLLCEPGDEVLVPRPSYPLFDCLAELDSVRLRRYRLQEDFDWRIDFEDLDQAAGERTRAVIVVNPNNPTGSYVHPADWHLLLGWAARRHVAVISDEVFYDYLWAGGLPRASGLAEQDAALVFTLSGLSKTAGLPQMKLGWVHVNGPAPARAEALERLEWIADAYLSVSAPVQHAAAAWLELAPLVQSAIRERCLTSLAALTEALPRDAPCRLLRPQGGWTAVVEAPRIRNDEDWALALLERGGFLLQPGYLYDFVRDGRLVLSVLSRAADLQSAMEMLLELCYG